MKHCIYNISTIEEVNAITYGISLDKFDIEATLLATLKELE